MMGVQVYLWMILVGVVGVWAETNDVSPQIPYPMYPSLSGRHELDVQSFQAEGNVLPPGPAQAVTPGVEGPQIQQEEEKEEQEIGGPLVSSEEEKFQSNAVPPTKENNPLPPDDIQNLLEEKEELLKQIKLLEEANRHLRIAESRDVGGEENGTYAHGDVINTLDPPNGKEITTTRPVDCADHLVLGATRSGVYQIYPFTCLCSKPVMVYCDMETDGGGWTVFLTREDIGLSHVNFNRSWADYKMGFGDPASEYWTGNEMLHTMTSSREYVLRLDLTIGSNDFKSALWDTVTVANEVNRYKITLGPYSAESTTHSNCLASVNSRFFSTYDRDYDSWSGNCAAAHGGFWFYNCNVMTPTSNYDTGLTSTCYNQRKTSATFVQLKIRPAICGSTFKTVYLNSYDCDSCH